MKTEKFCPQCKKTKLLKEFHKNKARHDGVAPYCKPCKNECRRQRFKRNRDYELTRNKLWAVKNRDKVNEIARKAYWKNPEKARARARLDYKNGDKAKQMFNRLKRRTLKIRALSITKKYEEDIKLIYKQKPEGYHVDHIIPLVNEKVCGLNVPWNLQYLKPSENFSKNNQFDGTYENESWKQKYRESKKFEQRAKATIARSREREKEKTEEKEAEI